MNPLDQVRTYLNQLEARLRWTLLSRGIAYTAISALAATVVLVLVINSYAFSEPSLYVARFLLFLSLGTAVGLGLIWPLLKLNPRRAARHAEAVMPGFQERLLTFSERHPANDPFLELLAADTMTVARAAPPSEIVHSRIMFAGLSASALATFILLWLIMAGPGFMGHGASLLWAGTPRDGSPRFYDILVTPGNKLVRRKADQIITARTLGFQPQKVTLFARYNGTSKWEQVGMVPTPAGSTYEFLFAGLPDTVEYYVESGAIRSKHFTLTAVDLPAVKKIKVTYHYPSWAGMKPVVDEVSADLRAVEGTDAEVAVLTDKALTHGVLIIDDGTQIELKAAEGNWLTGRVHIQKDGMYHVAAIEKNEDVRLSEDFFIEAQKETPPTVKIVRPMADPKVNPIEEITVAIDGQDDFGLQDLDLHYSVNGGAEKVVPVLKQKGAKKATGETVIALEDFKMQAGDIVSLYATARNARSQTRSDIMFIETQPFSRDYSQSQEGGGGGGGDMGDTDQNNVSQRQKELIAATFNQIRDRSGDKAKAAENGKFLSETQTALENQSRSLARRMGSRGLSGQGMDFLKFSNEMEAAAGAMKSASEKLKIQQWNDAMPQEQKALQHLLRAEAMIRDIKVAFARRGGGGGGGGGASRELANLFDLELDTEKNQYETGQSSSSEKRAKEVDNALEKLKQLARRQQELAQQQNNKQAGPQQRWQQEMLRREAEELKRQMEQLARNQSGQQSQSGQQGQSSQQSQAGQQGQSGQSGQMSRQSQGQGQNQGQQQMASSQQGRGGTPQQDRQLQEAIDRLTHAVDDMRKATGGQTGEQGSAESRRAAERLKEASDMLAGLQAQESGAQMDDIARRTERLAQEQQQIRDQLRKSYGNDNGAMQPGQSRQQAEAFASEKDRMSEEVKRLERDMQNAVRSMAGSDRKAASKLREALGEMQQKELALRMKFASDWLRRGYGGYVAPREDATSMIVNNLRDQVKDAQQAMTGGGKNGGQQGDSETEKALAQVERLRQQLESMSQRAAGRDPQGRGGKAGQQQGQQGQPGQNGQNGQQPGQGQQQAQNGSHGGQQPGNQQGQQGQAGQQPGNQQGQQGQAGQQGGRQGQPGQQAGTSQGARSEGEQTGQIGGQGGAHWGPDAYGNRGYWPNGPAYDGSSEQAYRDAMRSMQQLRQMVQNNPELARELGADIQGILHDMQRVDARQLPGNPAVIDQVASQVLPGVQQLELILRRKVEGSSGDVRSSGAERIPAGYGEAVAEYFRRLSKTK